MNILIAYFSKTGYTKDFACAIEQELIARGHTVQFEIITRVKNRSWIHELFVELPLYPSIGLTLISRWWRGRHTKNYHQIEEAIKSLTYPDISRFDMVCIGGPKWAHISYPVARYIKTVKGLLGKKVGAFATFGGPPFNVFELKMISSSMERALKSQGADIISEAYISSNYHQITGLLPIMRFFAFIVLKRPVSDFILGSRYAKDEIDKFCNDISIFESSRVEGSNL